MKTSIEIEPLVEVVRRHVKLSARAARRIEADFARLLQSPIIRSASHNRSAATFRAADTALSTQEAADLVGVSRAHIVARIEAGDIPLYQ